MLELDIKKFLDELSSMLQNKKNTRSIRLSIKRYYPEINGCRKKRKIQENQLESFNKLSSKSFSLIRLSDGKRRKSRTIIKSQNEIEEIINNIGNCISKSDYLRNNKSKS
ncbi:hypothetical protein ACR3K2_26800 [Cryptosporidium serpentis]